MLSDQVAALDYIHVEVCHCSAVFTSDVFSYLESFIQLVLVISVFPQEYG